MTTESTTSASPATTYTPGSARTPQQALGQDDFLKLLTVQLAKQDPMNPMTDTSFIAQMAQFSALQQASAMAKDMTAMRADAQMQAASALIGREVTVAMPDGDVTGTVNEVANDGDGMHVRIGETYYPFSLIYRVSAPTPETVTS
ncbi:MAG TPA: flagellar hook capping FlgD N-terminal domain-containing protein [Candidatus Synoicihabitans sp.]|nr:flagellar hook capping FlgD N-terminal domain-containing protein [Candidatus Synoicihabitans sp.]